MNGMLKKDIMAIKNNYYKVILVYFIASIVLPLFISIDYIAFFLPLIMIGISSLTLSQDEAAGW